MLTGKDATIGILAALAVRERTGRGQHVRADLLSRLLGGLVNQASGHLAGGTVPHRMGNQHPSIAPYETLRCADGVFAVACGNDRQFAKLAGVVGRPGLAADPRFATNSARVAHRRELITALERELTAAPAAHWQRVLLAAGVPAGQVGDIGDGIRLAEAVGLDPLLDLGPDRVPQIRNPVRLDSPSAAACPPPGLGEHSEALRTWLADPAAPPLPRPSADTKAGSS